MPQDKDKKKKRRKSVPAPDKKGSGSISGSRILARKDFKRSQRTALGFAARNRGDRKAANALFDDNRIGEGIPEIKKPKPPESKISRKKRK